MCFNKQTHTGTDYQNQTITLPHISLRLTHTHTHLFTHPYKMGLNSYKMVPFPHSSWKHFLPKIVLSSAFGQGHWRCCDCGSVSFHHRGGHGCQVLHKQERAGCRVLGSGRRWKKLKYIKNYISFWSEAVKQIKMSITVFFLLINMLLLQLSTAQQTVQTKTC